MSQPEQQQQHNQKTPSNPKPCCVCIPQKQTRDECLLLNGQDSGKCDSIIQDYKVCMKGFGFTI